MRIVLLLMILSAYYANAQSFDKSLDTAIDLYSQQKYFYRKYKYSKIWIDSTSKKEFYIFTFFPTKEMYVLLPNKKYELNSMKYIKSHPVVWYTPNNVNNNVAVLALSKIGMIDSIFIKIDFITDETKIPISEMDDEKKSFYIAINKQDITIIFMIKSNNENAIEQKIDDYLSAL